MSALASNPNLPDSDSGLNQALEKLESRTAPGEYSPAAATPATSVVEKIDESKLERGPGADEITHRPTGFRWALIMIAFLIGLFLFSLDNTIVADVQPAIVDAFQSVDQIAWLATGFLLPTVGLVLPFGQFGMIFPAKWFYIANIVIFEAGSALCGAAPNMNALIVGRVLAGIGAIGIYTGSLFLISVNTTEEERPRYIGMTGAMWGLGTVLGPVVGGAFTQSSATWRWAFYINLPIGALTFPILLFLIPPFDALKGISFLGRLRRIDWLGVILVCGAAASLVLALQFGGNQYSWNSGQVIGCFVSFGVLLIAFLISQTLFFPGQTKQRRIFPIDMVFNRTTILLFIIGGCGATSVFITLYYLPLYFQFTRGDDALKAAVRLLPIVFSLVFGSVGGGILLSKIGYYSPFYIVGSGLVLIGASLMHSITLDTSSANIYGYSILIGFGAGIYVQAGFAVAQAKMPKEQIASATGFIALGQVFTPLLALSIAGNVLINDSVSGLLKILPNASSESIKNAIAGTSGSILTNLDPDTRTAALSVIVSSIDKVYIIVIATQSLAFLCALLLRREKIVVKLG